jgi:5-methylcytosine-specific restriction endonuclease McrA
MSTQAQRARQRKKRDKADHLACMERADHTCQRCGSPATQTHHGKRKHAHVRHDRRYHYALCYECHTWAHRYVAAWDEWMNDNPNKEE